MPESTGFDRLKISAGVQRASQHVSYIKFYCCNMYLHCVSKSLMLPRF